VHSLDGGLNIMIEALISPTDGPIGDSSLWVEHDGVRILNQNDARPADLARFAELGHVHAHLLQFSGAIWYPMVYELPAAAKTAFGRQKRDRQLDRTVRYIDDLKASWVFPIAGPPCFLDDELWRFNDIFGDEGNIFPDQQWFSDSYRELGRDNEVILLPGTVATVSASGCRVDQPVPDVREFFAAKPAYLERMRDRKRPIIEAERATWPHPEIDVLAELKRRIEPLLEESVYLAKGVGGPVRFDLVRLDGSVECIVVDFLGGEVRPYTDEKVRYRFRTERALVEHLIYIDEGDWVNSLFLSCRFSAARIGQYNEFIYAFFKCLSEERLQYAEGWYDEHQRSTDVEDITLEGWRLQRRCPHLKADLTRFGKVDGDVLTCQLHGWRFDLPSGRCLTSAGHEIRATPTLHP
jgi:UDP-MurNAc hydroxylase